MRSLPHKPRVGRDSPCLIHRTTLAVNETNALVHREPRSPDVHADSSPHRHHNRTFDGIAASRDRLMRLVEAEAASGTPPSRVLLGGFSQGGALALHTALSSPVALGGVACIAGFLPPPAAAAATLGLCYSALDVCRVLLVVPPRPCCCASTAGRSTPVLWVHGRDDDVAPLRWAEGAVKKLRAMGCAAVRLEAFSGLGHNINEQVRGCGVRVRRRLPPPVPHRLRADCR